MGVWKRYVISYLHFEFKYVISWFQSIFRWSRLYNNRPYLHYLQDLRKRVIKILVILAILVIVITTFGIKMYDYGEYVIPILYPDLFDNIAIQTMAVMRQNLLPHNITLIQTTPGQA